MEELEKELQALNAAADVDRKRQLDVLNALVQKIRHFDPQRAFTLSHQAAALAQDLDYPEGRLASLVNLTVLNTHVSPNYGAALRSANQALALLESAPDASIHAYLFQCLATIYRHLGDHPTAQTYMMEALTLCRQADDQALEGLIDNDLGVLYRYTKDYELSLQWYEQALTIAQATGNQQRVALALNNIGDLFNAWGRPAEAIPYLQQSLALTRQLDIKILEPSLLDSLSEVYISQGNYAEALACLQQAQQIATEFGNQFELALLLRNTARIYQQQQAWEQALTYLHRSLAVAEAVKHKEGMYASHELLAAIYETQGEPAKALFHFKQFHQIKEELYNEQADQKLKTLQVIHETESAKQEAKLYRIKNVELQRALDQVKQLSGLLPICSSCKKIRDDGGYWQDVAVYIRDHSEAEFTHGICPDCKARLYPKYAQKAAPLQTA